MTRGDATRIYLLRHGQTAWNAEGRLQGRIDSPLSALGRAQAARLARALAHLPLAAVYSSPLSRARHTAEAIAVPHGLRVVTLDSLREVGLGVWEGLTMAEIEARFGPVIEARRRDPVGVTPEAGEAMPALAERGMRAVREVVDRHPGGTVVMVAHGALNRVVLLSVLGAPLSSYWRIRQDNAAINIVEFDRDRVRVVLINGTSHLDGSEDAVE